MKQPAGTTGNRNIVVDVLPCERLAIELGDGAILLRNGSLLADGLALAPAPLLPLTQPLIALLGVIVLRSVDGD